MATHIREYVARARSEPSTENIEALWRAVFMRKGWYFLPAERGEGPRRPAVMMVDDHPWIVAFTDVRHLEEFARSVGRADEDDEVFLLVLDPLESMHKIVELEDRVRGVVFNAASEASFRAPTEALIGYARHFGLPLEG